MYAGAGDLLHHPRCTFLCQFAVPAADKAMHGSRHGLRFRCLVVHHVTRADVMSHSMMQVRTKNFTPPMDLKSYGGLAFRVKGDGLRYKCTIRTDTNWDGIGYTL